jgi:hypothetical protein
MSPAIRDYSRLITSMAPSLAALGTTTNAQFSFSGAAVTVLKHDLPQIGETVEPARRECGVKKRVLVTGGAGFLGSHLCARLLKLARFVVTLTGSRSKLEFRPLPQDDPRQRRPDTTRARELLHWAPKVHLEEGLTRTIAYFDALLASPSEARKLIWKAAV